MPKTREFPATLEQPRHPARQHDHHRRRPTRPSICKTAGKFSTPTASAPTELGTVPGMDGVRPTGLSLPFDGQAVQGFSGIKTMADGTFWSLSDNGFGNKLNSVDAALMLHHLKFDWETARSSGSRRSSSPIPTRRCRSRSSSKAARPLPDRCRFRRRSRSSRSPTASGSARSSVRSSSRSTPPASSPTCCRHRRRRQAGASRPTIRP